MGCSVKSARSLTATALLAAVAVTGLPGLSSAQERPAGEAAQSQPRSFNIPPQPLAGALAAFGQQSGMQVSISAGVAQGVQSGGVTGSMTPRQALERLLAGTGITYTLTGGNTAMLQPISASSPAATQLDPVRVQANAPPLQAEIGNLPPAYAGGQVARGGRVGLLGERDYMETPYSTTTYTEKYIQDQQARTLIEVVQDDPTIRPFFAQGAWNDTIVIRGFTAGTASFNGLFGIAPDFALPMAGIERVEVFRGASSMLTGVANEGAVGGTVNLVPKRATDQPINQVTALYTSNSQLGVAADVGRRFGPDNAAGLRLNAYYSDGKTPANLNNDQLLNLTAGFDYRGEDTRLDADFGWMQRNINGLRSEIYVAPGLQVPPAPSSYNNASQPWQFYDSNSVYGLLRFEHDFTPSTTGFLRIGGQRSTGNVLIGFPTISNAQGDTNSFSIRAVIVSEYLSSEAGVRTRFNTGSIRHEVSLNGLYLLTQTATAFTPIAPAASNIYSPIIQPTPNYFFAPTAAVPSSQQLQTSIGLIDSMFAFDDRVQLLAGGRVQRVQVSNYGPFGYVTPATPGSDQSAITPTVALVVRPVKELSLYGNFIQALEPGPVAGAGFANAGEAFPPTVSTQFELGAKIDLGRFGATLSAFSITKPSTLVDLATNTFTVAGEQRNQGIEFTMFGEPLPGLKPLGGFALMNPILTSTAGGVNNGKTAPGVANFQANLGLDWQTPFVKGLGLAGRIVYTGQTYLDPANTQPVPPWTRVDLGASYTFEPLNGKALTARLNVVNVGNTNYWMASPVGSLTQSAARTFYLSLAAAF